MHRNLKIVASCVAFSLVAAGQNKQVRAVEPVDVEEAVIQADDRFQRARLKNDTTALQRIFAENYYETSQNGDSRNKVESIEQFRRASIKSLTTDAAQVRLTGNTAIVTGLQTEDTASGIDRTLFMRVWVKDKAGWKLAGAMQYRNPKQ